jgi:hypothetical protein
VHVAAVRPVRDDHGPRPDRRCVGTPGGADGATESATTDGHGLLVPLLAPRRGLNRLAEDAEGFLGGIQTGPVAAVFIGPAARLRQQLLESLA